MTGLPFYLLLCLVPLACILSITLINGLQRRHEQPWDIGEVSNLGGGVGQRDDWDAENRRKKARK